MFDEWRKSIQLILHERRTSPLSGALILSWLFWNWKIPYFLLFSDVSLKLSDRLSYIETRLTNVDHNIRYPILSALFLILLYPIATTWALKIWLRYRRWQNSVAQEIELTQRLTVEQSVQLMVLSRKKESELADLIKSKDEQIDTLRAENREILNQLNPNKANLLLPMTDLAKRILVEASQDKYGAIRFIEAGGSSYVQTNEKAIGKSEDAREQSRLKAALQELDSNEYLNQEEQSYYKLTEAGFAAAAILRRVERNDVKGP